MPNWTDDEGTNWFKKLRYKRCGEVFEENEEGEVTIHLCLGECYTSGYDGLSYHAPIKVETKRGIK